VKLKRRPSANGAIKASIVAAIDKAANYAPPKRAKSGPEPERFKIEGYSDWKDAVKDILKKPKPKGGWPK
jgi:hypothetical protein